MFESFKENVKFVIEQPEVNYKDSRGIDTRYYYYDEEEGIIKEKKKPKKPLYLHVMYSIYLGTLFIIKVIRYTAAGFYWFWAWYKGTLHERHILDPSAQNYLIVTFVVIPAVMYWYNVYL